jgi:hypothetical protein
MLRRGIARASRALPPSPLLLLSLQARYLATDAPRAPAPPSCLYALLGLDPAGAASRRDIKRAFREVAKRTHPDATRADDAVAAEAFVRVLAAYEILSCEKRRALYDAERLERARRTTDDDRDQSSSSSSSRGRARDAADAFEKYSDVWRDYNGAVDALVPKRALAAELRRALEFVAEGPEVDVDAVRLGEEFPRRFETEERATAKVVADREGVVDLAHVVSGRTVLAVIREARAREEIGEEIGAEGAMRALAGAVGGGTAGAANEANEATEEDDAQLCDGGDPPDARHRRGRDDAKLELVVGGRVVAIATRRDALGDVVVRRAPDATADEAVLRAASTSSGGAGDAYRSNSISNSDGLVCVVSALDGVVTDAGGTTRHRIVAHATPGVTRLAWIDAAAGVVVAKATRAWLPPSDAWLFAPRSRDHDIGGWYFELRGGRKEEEGLLGEGEDARDDDAFRAAGRDFRAFAKAAGADPDAAARRRRDAVALPPAVALFCTAFRLLDRERGEARSAGGGGAVRRMWERVFGRRY